MEARKHKHGFIVGAFIILAVAIFIMTVFTLGGEQKSFSKKFYINVVFNEVNGLKEGNNVWFDGVKIGTVKKIALKAPSEVEVLLSVEKKSQPFIKQNAMAKIGSDGFLGNKIVIIYGGTTNTSPVENNAYLLAQTDTLTNEDMLATLQSSNKNLLEITNNIKAITQQIKEGKGTAGKLITDTSLANSLQKTLNDFKIIAAKGKQSVANIQDFTARIDTKTSSVNKLFSDTLLYDSIKSAIIELKSTIQKANIFADNINIFSKNISTASDKLSDTTNTAGMILNDKQTANDLQTTMQNLKAASKKLDEDLEALQHNFLLKGYFRKKNKTQQ